MLCPSCRRQVARAATFCPTCGASLSATSVPFELVLRDGTRVPIADTVTIGRAAGNEIRIDDDSVSRRHARIVSHGPDRLEIEDAGSTYGTFVGGKRLLGSARLADGARIQLGDVELRVERRRASAAAGRTIVVPVGGTLLVPAAGAARLAPEVLSGLPRVRSGWALKRLDESEGAKRYVLKDLRSGRFMRMSDEDAALFELLDGRSSVHELVAEAERRVGPGGALRLTHLVADLGAHGFLAGVEDAGAPSAPAGRLGRALRPREWTAPGAGALFDRLYRYGGFLLFTRTALVLLGTVAVAGIGAFAYVVLHRYGTPFVVARKIGLGALVFLLGRFVVVAFHEAAHGLTVTSFGRRVSRAGVKSMLVFPYAFVDTSDAWFEPRRRRPAISAAGPLSDLVVGGCFALAAAALPAGTMRDIVFQLAFAAYVGAFFNLNPFLDRDGYHLLVDLLREPGLRRRSRERLARRLAGERSTGDERRVVSVYGVAALVWSVIGVAFAVAISTRYWGRLEQFASREVIVIVFGFFYALMLLPVAVGIGRPLLERRRGTAVSGVDSATA